MLVDLIEVKLAAEFELLGDWEERYRYVIDLGKDLAPLGDAERSDANKVRGCASQVWLATEPGQGGVLEFRGARLIDDTYNSNPRALESMIEALRQTPATRRFVIAGEMLELGPEGAALHRAAGEQMAGLDGVVGVRGLASEIVEGARAKGVTAQFVDSPGEASVWLEENLRKGDVVLLKGSRGVRLERALEALQE